MRVLIVGSCNTEASSSKVISGGAIGFSEVMEIDEDDEAGEEDIVDFVLSFSDSLKGIEFVRWCW